MLTEQDKQDIAEAMAGGQGCVVREPAAKCPYGQHAERHGRPMATGVSDTFTRRFDKEMHATIRLIAMRGLPTGFRPHHSHAEL